MPQILVRDLEADVVTRLKERALRHGRSLESEARMILEGAAGFSAQEARQVVDKWSDRLASRPLTASQPLLDEDRRR